MMDPINYCHDCVLLCGRVVGNDPDGQLDEWATEKRILATRQLLRARYESEVDNEIWNFATKETRHEMVEHQPSRSFLARERSSSVLEERESVGDDERYEDEGVERVNSKYSNYDILFRSGLSVSASKSPGKTVDVDSAEMIKDEAKAKPVSFQIRIRTLKGQVYHLAVTQDTTISKIKTIIEQEHGTPKDQQHLLFYGKVLEDWKTLGAHNIPANAGLQLLARSKRTGEPALENQAESIVAA